MNHLYKSFVCMLIACSGGSPEDTGLEVSEYRDVDRDGYNEKLDCDDYNAYVNPGQHEYCDGIDNNCDGLIDGIDSKDVIEWYQDVDDDGYGNSNAETLSACHQPEGYVCSLQNGDDPCDDRCDNDQDGLMDDEDPDCIDSIDSGEYIGEARPYDQNDDGEVDFDCDDEDYLVNPGEDESCADSRDNDCDAIPDSEEVDTSDGAEFFQDLDGDGFGDLERFVDETDPLRSNPLRVCQQPSAYVLDDTDCDDTDLTVFPGAIELCDGQYNNCSVADYSTELPPQNEQDQDTDGFVGCEFPDVNDPDTDLCGSVSDFSTCWHSSAGTPIGGGDCFDDLSAEPFAAEVNPGSDEVCDGLDNDCDGIFLLDEDGIESEIDRDEDGYVSCTLEDFGWRGDDLLIVGGDDCFDARTFDPLDLDGDGDVGEFTSAWVSPMEVDAKGTLACMSDIDGDTEGASTWSFGFMSAPSNWTAGPDCDDLNAGISTTAQEVCLTDSADGLTSGIDDDCDDEIDEDEATDVKTWYEDFDGDGYGNADSQDIDCDRPEGFVADDSDCDDTEPLQFPLAPEVCNDGIVNDCNISDVGGDAETPCQLDLSGADTRISSEEAGDHLGISIAGIGDINEDTFDDFMVSGWNADGNNNGDHEGAAWLFLGPGSIGHNPSLSVADASLVFSGNVDGDKFGYQVANLGDIDGDTLPDIGISGTLIGDHPDETLTANGSVYIFLGETLQAAIPSSGTGSLDPDDADIWIYGEANYDELGDGLKGLGDLNGDGFDDFAIGCTNWDDADSQEGGVFIYYGASTLGDSGTDREWDVAEASMVLSGDEQNDRVGDVFTGALDMNDDGLNDLLIGTKTSSSGATNSGAIYLGLGPLSDAINASKNVGDLDAAFYGRSVDDAAGSALGVVGNINEDNDAGGSDGYDDLLVGASGDDTDGGDSSGSVFLIYGTASFEDVVDGEDVEDLAGVHFYGFEDAGIGTSVDASHDFDLDGINDILIGASTATNPEASFANPGQGLTYLIYGTTSYQSVDVSAANPAIAVPVYEDANAIFYGSNVNDNSGSPVLYLGDPYENDSATIGIASINDSSTSTLGGAVYLIQWIGE